MDLLVVTAGTALILSAALVNGYPLVYSDTGTYLRSAFTGYVPEDRPYWYGLFIQITSGNGRSLWGVVVAQAALCSALLWRCWRVFGDARAWTFLFTVATLAPFSGLGWYAGQLVADIFTVIGVLAGVLVLFGGGRAWQQALLGLLIIMSCWVHLSNLLILPLVLGCVWCAARWSRSPARPSGTLMALCTLVIGWPTLWMANKAISGDGHISRYSHVFLMSRMAESGIIHRWLKEHCPDDPTPLCAYTDSIPRSNKAFMWTERSPLHWQGGPHKVREEWRGIFQRTLLEPKYLAWHIKASLVSTAELLTLWKVAAELEGDYYRQDYSAPYGSIAGLMPHELDAFLHSEQNSGTGKLWMRVVDPVYSSILALSIIAALVLVWPNRRDTWTMLMVGVSTLLFGAWVCASLSTVDSRFMGRTAWLLPMMVAMAAWKLLPRSTHRTIKPRPNHTNPAGSPEDPFLHSTR